MIPQVDAWQHKVDRKLSELSQTGSWCAYRYNWNSGNAVVTYEEILHADSNMDSDALNVGTGENLITTHIYTCACPNWSFGFGTALGLGLGGLDMGLGLDNFRLFLRL